MTSIEKALQLIRSYPRVTLNNVKDLPRSIPPPYDGLKRKKRGLGHRGLSQFQAWLPLGDMKEKTPFYLTVPKETYQKHNTWNINLKRISLLELQRLIDLKRVDPQDPIDLTTLCNTKLYHLNVELYEHYGFHLTDEGLDNFVSPVNIEVQYASEPVIAAIERAGGAITTRFYDLFSVWAKCDPLSFFKRGIPIPRAKLPPTESVAYYTSAESRGYMADPEEVAAGRVWLAQKYGYPVIDLSEQADERQLQMMKMRKDPRQIFYGLEPGWLVSLKDRVVLKPKSNLLSDHYQQ